MGLVHATSGVSRTPQLGAGEEVPAYRLGMCDALEGSPATGGVSLVADQDVRKCLRTGFVSATNSA